MVESRVYFNNFYLLCFLRTTIPIRMTVLEISLTLLDKKIFTESCDTVFPHKRLSYIFNSTAVTH